MQNIWYKGNQLCPGEKPVNQLLILLVKNIYKNSNIPHLERGITDKKTKNVNNNPDKNGV